MGVIHIMKDGSRREDITGLVVPLEDAGPLYRYIHSINQGVTNNTYEQTKQEVQV